MTPPRPICGIGLALSNHLAFFFGLLLAFFGSDHTVTARASKQAIVLVKLWAVVGRRRGVPASLHAPGAANKNFIGIVEVNNELPINPRPICGSTRLAFPGSFILALAQFVKPVPPLPLPLQLPLCWCGAARHAASSAFLTGPPDLAHTVNKKRLIKGPDFNQVSRCTAHSPSQSM